MNRRIARERFRFPVPRLLSYGIDLGPESDRVLLQLRCIRAADDKNPIIDAMRSDLSSETK